MPHCVVCAIASGQLEAHVVFENQHIVCFLDHMPINEGHVLLCPRGHHADLTDLPEGLLAELMLAAKALANKLQGCLKCDGVSLLQNNGRFNELGHFHLHLFPRFQGDGFSWVSHGGSLASREALARVNDVLRNAVD